MDQLWLMRSDGTHARLVIRASGGFSPIVWSPDSSHVLAGAWGGLRLIDRRQGRVRLLAGTGRYTEQVSFSPDGRRIAFEREDQTGGDIFVVSTSGGAPRRLTHDHKSYAPLWGPSRIAYLRGRGFVDGDIWLIGGDGKHNLRLTTHAAGFYPAAWSRSGRRLLGANPAVHNGRLWAIQVPSGAARPVTKWVGDLFAQGLSRDERHIYAAIGCGGTASSNGFLETIPFSGGPPRVIVRGPCRGSWSA
jgi:Tol biopolymer transport system component